jgi:hypothetical protein
MFVLADWRTMRHMKAVLTVISAMVAFSGMIATGAGAFHPLYLTQSGKELLVTNEGGLGVIRGLAAGVLGTIECHKFLAHGWVLNKSTLAHRIKITFHTGCTEIVGSTKEHCTEPIVLKEMLSELGLIGGNKVVGVLLAPSDGTKVFVNVTCGPGRLTVEGATIAEVPEINAKGVNQYNKQLTEGEAVLEAENKTENQKFTSIELLEVVMTKAELTVSGFFGGKASVEGREVGKNAGWIEICTRAPANCP